MSTATIDIARSTRHAPARAIIRRFMWKEFRMLRGLWLAVSVLGAIFQWAINVLIPPSLDHATFLFAAALGAAALYAVGAAATTFSVEHEDDTYDFLVGLPVNWWPIYAGKLIVVTASAVALAASLSILGWSLSGFGGTISQDTVIAFGVFGVAIPEAIAWGTLFSLLMKRPLVAAILTLIVAAVAINLAVFLSASYAGANLNPTAYLEATPLRLAFAAVALGCSAVAARRWLPVGTQAVDGAHFRGAFWRRPLWAGFAGSFRRVESAPQSRPRHRMLPRLLWQTWRDSWKVLMLPIGIAAVLVSGTMAVIVLTGPREELRTAAYAATALFVPALYGALAFSADQRRRSYRFLAEHAAGPRYVWLARHVVWLGTLVTLSLAIWLAATAVTALGFRFVSERFLEDYVRWNSMPEGVFHLSRNARYVVDSIGLVSCGILTVYGVGQFCSMLVRSEILAAFIALVLSIFICAWAAVLFVWELSAWIFLFPIAAAFMWATWLRVPDWIADRNSWRVWFKPALPVVATLVAIGLALPVARLAQVENQPRSMALARDYEHSAQSIDLESFVAVHAAGGTPEARETAAMYLRAVELLHSWEENDPLEPWNNPDYARRSKSGATGGIDEMKIPPDQREAYFRANERRLEMISQSQVAAVKLAIEASARSSCRFDFGAQVSEVVPAGGGLQWILDATHEYVRLNKLLETVWSTPPDAPFDHLLAALRMSTHLASDQPSIVLLDQLDNEKAILQQIGVWAGKDSRTKEELKSALDQLTAHFRVGPWLPTTLITDHRLVGDVLRGDVPPLVLAQTPDSPLVHMAYLANQLPWERQRALLALDVITRQNITDAEGLRDYLMHAYPRELGIASVRRWLRPIYAHDWTETWVKAQPAAATSYLARLEYETRAPVDMIYRAYCNNQTFRRAALLQIALAMYRRDHGAYPNWLSELVPDYLDHVPIDPFSGQEFVYEAAGFELPLRGLRDSNFQRIEANTPLFWSVGAGNARLKHWSYTEVENDENDPQRELETTTQIAYVLESEEPPWMGEPAFAFPLPK